MTRRRAAVLGSPIAHSLSPVLHRAAYDVLGLDWAYDVVECDERALPAVMARLAAGPYVGASLTMPLKRAVLPLLDEIDPRAAAVGAVNTVLFAGGRRVGYNTDVAGIRAAVRELGVEDPAGAVVLGGGATACSALAALASLGARDVTVVVRNPAAAGDLQGAAARLEVHAAVVGWADKSPWGSAPPLAVSTVPAGATDPLATRPWPAPTALLDVVYAPWPTPLAAAAGRAGAPVVGGLSVLVGQAAEAVTLMTGQPAPLAAMRAAGDAALRSRSGG